MSVRCQYAVFEEHIGISLTLLPPICTRHTSRMLFIPYGDHPPLKLWPFRIWIDLVLTFSAASTYWDAIVILIMYAT